jgi:hypothetical protein
MTEATQLPADDCPEVGAVYNYEGQNFAVTRVDPDSFVVFGNDDEWTDAIEFTDHVGEGETATVRYVMALDLFVESYELGIIDEGEGDDAEATQLPADEPQAKPKG